MSSNPKIVVVKMREIIYTLLLLFLVALLILCLVLMFAPKSDKSAGTDQGTTDTQTQSDTRTAQSLSGTRQTEQTQTNVQQQSGLTQTDAPRQNGSDTSSVSEPAVQTAAAQASYVPGVYTTPVTLGESSVDVEVTVDSSHINGIRLVNLSETTAAAYPLVSPSLDHIASQILMTQGLEGITCPQENKYTSQLLLSAISDALDRAAAR